MGQAEVEQVPSVKFELTPKQSLAYHFLTDDRDRAVLYGGAKGGAKSFLFCIWTKLWVEHLIKFFKLKPTKNPISLGFIGRKRSIDFHDTTLEDFKRIIPSDHYRLHDDEHEIIFHESAKVFCGGLDDPKRIEKFNSANYAFFAIDQAEETERTDVSVLQATLRMKHLNLQPPYKQLYTANPADCWLKEDFIDNRRKGYVYIPALYTDNPHLPTNYRTTLENAFRYNDSLLRAYRDGDWSALQSENILITTKMLNDLKLQAYVPPKDTRRIISCDPALGGDECVAYAIEDNDIKAQMILHERDAMKVAGHLNVFANRHHTDNFAIDTIGLGGPIAHRIKEMRPDAHVESIQSASSARNESRFSNVRAEMWWTVMELIQDKLIPYPEDEELRSQLSSLRFKVVNSNGKIQLEPKADTKKRIGRSPDRADAFVMGLYALPRTSPISYTNRFSPNRGYRSRISDDMFATNYMAA